MSFQNNMELFFIWHRAVCFQRAQQRRGEEFDFEGFVYWTPAPSTALRKELQTDDLLINLAFSIFWCTWLRDNQMLISYHHKCPVHIGWAGCSLPSRIAAMSHLFTMIFFILEVSPHQSLANVLTSPFFKIFCHRSACRSNTIYCGSLLVAKLHFPFVRQFFFPTEPCSADGRYQWHFLQHLKGGLLPSLISWVHVFMLMKAVHELDGGSESVIFSRDDYWQVYFCIFD